LSTRNLDLEVIEKALTSCPFGHPIFFRETLSSTQELAKELALSGAPEGALVLAECQSNGRGRLGRRWFSPERGGIYMSTILRPTIPLSDAQLLSLAAAVAVSEAMGKVYGLAVQVKWPNDILYDQKKLCGILGETTAVGERVIYSIIGVGVNANILPNLLPDGLREQATSLCDILGHEVCREELVAAITKEIYRWTKETLYEGKKEELLHEYERRCGTLGQEVVVESGQKALRGVAKAIGPDGALVVSTAEGDLSITAAAVYRLRKAKPI